MSDTDLTDEEIAAWELPFLEQTENLEPQKTNAFNRQSTWRYEPPEEQPEDVAPPTAEEIESIRESAYKEGFEQGKAKGEAQGFEEGKQQGLEQGQTQGYEEGHQQGLAAGEDELKALLEHWQGLIDQLQQPVHIVEEQLKSELVKLSVSLARAVIRADVQTNPQILLNALNAGLKILPIQEASYHIHMHPEDIDIIKQHFSEEHIEKHHWVFVENPDMSRGGCDISTQNNAVDVSIERRVKDVLDKFLLEQGLSDLEPH
ncbi:flagellar assembly protein FliH [Aliiglaciecola litoralis]|uniref:Flagellar assembly protein FliH n=1 Tax=Aliiglaciecola litoralis TaxID=582857 RepID=A0ABP3WR07_9ALTE